MIDLSELTVQDLKDIEKLQEFRKETERLYNIIIKIQRVPLILDNQNRYTIWNDGNNIEYLELREGEWIWEARYLHQSYDVPINLEKIFNMMVRAYENAEYKNTARNIEKEAIDYFTTYTNNLLRKK